MENDWLGKLSSLVSGVAPVLGAVLGTPLASVGVSLIGNAIGLKEITPEKVLQGLLNDSNAMGKLVQIEYDHRIALAKIASENYKIEVDDRKSARLRELSINDHVPMILAISYLLIYAGIQFYCVLDKNPNNDILSARFQDVLIMIISYYFGSAHKVVTKD